MEKSNKIILMILICLVLVLTSFSFLTKAGDGAIIPYSELKGEELESLASIITDGVDVIDSKEITIKGIDIKTETYKDNKLMDLKTLSTSESKSKLIEQSYKVNHYVMYQEDVKELTKYQIKEVVTFDKPITEFKDYKFGYCDRIDFKWLGLTDSYYYKCYYVDYAVEATNYNININIEDNIATITLTPKSEVVLKEGYIVVDPLLTQTYTTDPIGNHYGTKYNPVTNALEAGSDALLIQKFRILHNTTDTSQPFYDLGYYENHGYSSGYTSGSIEDGRNAWYDGGLRFDDIQTKVVLEGTQAYSDFLPNTGIFTLTFATYVPTLAETAMGATGNSISSAVGGYGVFINTNDITLILSAGTGGGGSQLFAYNNNVVANTWQNWTVIGNGSVVGWYLNGVWKQNTTMTYTKGATNINSNISIGTVNDVFTYHYKGGIRNVALFNRTLTDAEISTLNTGNLGVAPLHTIFNYTLNDGSGNVATDTSGRNFKGQLSNYTRPNFYSSDIGYLFDGYDDTINIYDSSSLDLGNDSQFGLTLWFRPNNNQTNQTLISKRGLTQGNGWELVLEDSYPTFYLANSSSNLTLKSGLSVTENSNNLIVIGMLRGLNGELGQNITLYHNTIKQDSFDLVNTTWEKQDFSNSHNLYIGSLAGETKFYNGSLRDVMIFNYSITPTYTYALGFYSGNESKKTYIPRYAFESAYYGNVTFQNSSKVSKVYLNGFFNNASIQFQDLTSSELIHYYSFDNDYSTLKGSNTGIPAGEVQLTGRGVNGSVFFTGQNTKLDLTTPLTNNLNKSIALWVNLNRDLTTSQILYSSVGSSTDKFALLVSGGKLVCERFTGTMAHKASSTLSQDTWYYVVCGLDNNVPYLYIDGVLQTESGTTVTPSNTVGTTIGADTDGTDKYMGFIDELKIWNKVFTYSDVWFEYKRSYSNPINVFIGTFESPPTIFDDWNINYSAFISSNLDTGEFVNYLGNPFFGEIKPSKYLSYIISFNDELGLGYKPKSNLEITPRIFNISFEFETITSPFITYKGKTPADITTTNLFDQYLNITFEITSLNGMNTSKSELWYKVNNSLDANSYYINGVAYGSNYLSSLNTTLNHILVRNISDDYTFSLSDNEVYPAIYNYPEVEMVETPKSNYSLSTSNRMMQIEFLNMLDMYSPTHRNYSFLEINVANSSSSSNPLIIYYCNATGKDTNPSTSSSCSIIGDIINTQIAKHTHGNYSEHYTIPLGIDPTTSKLNGIVVTNTSYFILRGATNGWDVKYIPNVSRTDAIKTSINNGGSWSNFAGTPDAHLHFMSSDEQLWVYACGEDLIGYSGCSNETYIDTLGLGGINPSAPYVYEPSGVYRSTSGYNINYTISISPNAYSIQNYTIIKYNASNFADLGTIVYNNYPNLSYFFSSADTEGEYIIGVRACDQYNYCSLGLSEPFNLTFYITYSNIIATANTSGATITWNTDIEANETIYYSTSPTLSTYSTYEESDYGLTHSIELSGLSNNTVYYYKLSGCNIYNSTSGAYDCDNSTIQTFTTGFIAPTPDATAIEIWAIVIIAFFISAFFVCFYLYKSISDDHLVLKVLFIFIGLLVLLLGSHISSLIFEYTANSIGILQKEKITNVLDITFWVILIATVVTFIYLVFKFVYYLLNYFSQKKQTKLRRLNG